MPSFCEHIGQAKHNLKFIEELNRSVTGFWDWQVTACFYVAVHVINAHLAKNLNIHYRKHTEVFNAINPFNPSAGAVIRKEEYFAFKTLNNLSRRSRYLISDDMRDRSGGVHFTQKKHFDKAIRNLDILIRFANKVHKSGLPVTTISSGIPKPGSVTHFKG
jgi:hypothetical protein